MSSIQNDHITFKQMRVCVIRASEIADDRGASAGDMPRLEGLCERYGAEFDFNMMDLADTLAVPLMARGRE